MNLEAQNARFLKWADEGGKLPKYEWPENSPNCPPKPDSHELQHLAEFQARVNQYKIGLTNWIQQNRGEKTAQMRARFAELVNAIGLQMEYENDITRTDEFAQYVAYCQKGFK